MTTLYGISNCDTVRKARKWLESNGIEYQFHDFRKDGLTAASVEQWCAALGADKVLNKRGTTWRQLPAEQQAAAADPAQLVALLTAQPTLIKRPLLARDGSFAVGFSTAQYAELFGA